MISLQQLNSMSAQQFIQALAGVYERSPWVPERVAEERPFASVLQLHASMCNALFQAGSDEQLTLIRAHPELAGRAAIQGELTVESTREQQGAGLSACTPEEFARLHALNQAYSQKFGFPFILAVKGHTRASIIRAMEARISHSAEEERLTALREINRIAAFRLTDLVSEPAGARIMAMAEQLARFSDHEEDLTCVYLSAAHRATAAQIRDWMLAEGLHVETDAVGNLVGRLACENRNAPTLMTGSHYDTVINAGKYDGRLGILLPIVVAGQLHRDGVKLPYHLEIVAFADEEGVRFGSTFLGSRAVAGCFDSAMLDQLDQAGTSMRQALCDAGLDPAAIGGTRRDPASLMGFIEVHIEQGPVLLNEGLPVGVVTSIAGAVRASVSVTGVSGHAGTVPMQMRRDAAAAAAEVVLAVERHCSQATGVVGTVGKLEVPHGAINVIPGRCQLTLDIRAASDELRRAAYAAVTAECEQIAVRRKVQIEVRKILETDCVPCAQNLQERWAAGIQRVTGHSTVRHLPSGAGHDAMIMATITDIGMLFVRCGNGGISHHPSELLSEEDADIAARVFADFLLSYPTHL